MKNLALKGKVSNKENANDIQTKVEKSTYPAEQLQ